MKTLTLPLKRKWFDMIKSGEKKEEYRKIKPYYEKRFLEPFSSRLFRKGETGGKAVRHPRLHPRLPEGMA